MCFVRGATHNYAHTATGAVPNMQGFLGVMFVRVPGPPRLHTTAWALNILDEFYRVLSVLNQVIHRGSTADT